MHKNQDICYAQVLDELRKLIALGDSYDPEDEETWG